MDTVFMIRDGLFGSSYELKFLMIIVTLFLVYWDWKIKSRFDYLWIFIFGTFIWSVAELILKVYGIRNIMQATLFSFDISNLIAALLRGSFEGASVTIFGIFIGDRILSKDSKEKTLAIGVLAVTLILIIFVVWMQALPSKNIGGEVISKRDIFHPVPITFVFCTACFVLYWLVSIANNIQRKRVVSMYLTISAIVFVWTVSEVTANTRWIESGTFSLSQRATPLIEFGVLAWDIFIEVSISFLPFIVLPYVFRLIR